MVGTRSASQDYLHTFSPKNARKLRPRENQWNATAKRSRPSYSSKMLLLALVREQILGVYAFTVEHDDLAETADHWTSFD